MKTLTQELINMPYSQASAILIAKIELHKRMIRQLQKTRREKIEILKRLLS